MGKGGGSDVRETKSTTEPPEFLRPYLESGIQDLTGLYESGSAPGYYPGQTFAGMSPQTQSAIDMITGRATAGSPLTAAAQDQLTRTMAGEYLDPNSNPNFQAALAAGFAPQTENFMNKVLPGITSAFEGSGRTGSGLHQQMVEDATMNLNRSQAEAAATAGANMYGMERANQIAGMKFAPQLAMQDYFDASQLAQAGSAAEDYAQRGIDESVARYNYENNKDWDYINRYLASLGAGYPGGTSSGTTTGGDSGGGLGSALGGLGSLASLGMMAFSMFSDERLKEDIEPVGALNDGQTVYAYRYKGDPTPRIGLMAQEVAQTHPEAVHLDPSGYLKVDYDAATRDARGLF